MSSAILKTIISFSKQWRVIFIGDKLKAKSPSVSSQQYFKRIVTFDVSNAWYSLNFHLDN